MRLINADDLIAYIESTGLGIGIDTSQKDIIKAIEACPTAYDVDKVINCLEREKSKAKSRFDERRRNGV